MQDGSSLFFNWCSTGTYSASYLMIFSPDKNLPQKAIKQIPSAGDLEYDLFRTRYQTAHLRLSCPSVSAAVASIRMPDICELKAT